MRGQVDGFEGLADHQEGKQFTGRELDDSREVAVPALEHRLRVLVDDMRIEECDHRNHCGRYRDRGSNVTAPADWTLLTAARLLDGSGTGRLDDAAVLIEGGTIRAIGRRSEVRPPDGVRAISHEYGDATILPGLVDGHTHLVGIGDGTRGDDLAAQGEDLLLIRATVNARAMLHSGVTTIRENGSMGRIAFSVREAIRRGIAEGPRMVVAGRAVTITGGHLHWFGGEADGPDDLRRTVRQLVKDGADFVKIMASGGSTRSSHPNLPAFTPDELRAIVDEAHRHERLTAAHAVPNAAIEDCLEAGLDMIIHCSMSSATGTYVYRPDLADRMAETGVWVNPTMHDIRAWLWYYRDEEAAGRPLDPPDVATRDELRRLYDDKVDAVRRLHAAGVRLIAGSDSAWGRSRAGGGWLEIDALTDAGLSTAQAIAAGTTASAEAIGVGDDAGCLAPGRPADLLVVGGDPLAGLRVLGDPLDVFQGGRRIIRSREGASA
jgi:imidazolonepropionase-like amidohydrolase